MKIHKPKFRFTHIAINLTTVVVISLLAGCMHSNSHISTEIEDHTTIYNEPRSNITQIEKTSVVCYGRYTLVEVGATSSQHDLLAQIIDITIPVSPKQKITTVAEAIRYVLLNSGYQLCDSKQISAFSYFSAIWILSFKHF